ncbi:MAG: hypothetical protein PHF23_09785 [Smithellaceae bacterium]|jgi:pimeloyl-ACP methyl ester carboxylesterase|nr:hypothetical protein [Smithellaceae bacterium]
MDLWFAQIEASSKEFRVIAPDNRGIGRSDKPDDVYSMELMASDTVGLLRLEKPDRLSKDIREFLKGN